MFGSDMKDSDRPLSEKDLGRTGGRAHACPVSEEDKMAAAKADLGLSGEGFGLRGGGVRGTAGLGAMEAAGIKP